jgi:hypothetical protein
MSSAAQITANQANSQFSTGPITADGKRIASSNSIRHGLTAKQIVIPGEDPAEFEELRSSLQAEMKPATAEEAALVEQIAQHTWRLQRARRLETASYHRFMPDLKPSPRHFGGKTHMVTIDPEQALATAFHNNAQAFDRLRRHEATIERSYYKAINELRKLQTERRLQQPPQPPAPPIGSVLQKPIPTQIAPDQATHGTNPNTQTTPSNVPTRQAITGTE